MIAAFQDCGLADNGGMAKTPLSWQEVKAYSDLTKTNLTAWEAKQVVYMSRAYCSMNHEATENRLIKPVYDPELTEEEIYNRGALASGQATQALDITNY